MDTVVRTDADALGLSSRRLADIDGWMDRFVAGGKLASNEPQSANLTAH